jgi:heme exporter protein D
VVWVAVGFALVVLGLLIHSRMQQKSADQQILIEKSHQH